MVAMPCVALGGWSWTWLVSLEKSSQRPQRTAWPLHGRWTGDRSAPGMTGSFTDLGKQEAELRLSLI